MQSRLSKIMNCMIAAVCVAIILAAVFINSNTTFRAPESGRDFVDGWVLIEENGDGEEITFPYTFAQPTIRLKNVLPHVDDESILLVKCNFQSMKAEINGEIVYESDPATLGPIRTDTGHYFAMIPLQSGYTGMELELTIQERETGYNAQLKNIQVTTVAAYGFEELWSKLELLLVAIMLLMVSVVAFSIWFIFRSKLRKRGSLTPVSLLWFGIFSANLGIWLLTDPHFLGMLTGRFATSGILNYASLMMIPVSMTGLLRSMCNKRFRFLDAAVYAFQGLMIAEGLLFLTGVQDLSEMLKVIQVSNILAMAFTVVVLLVKKHDFSADRVMAVGMMVSLLFSSVALMVYVAGGEFMPYILVGVVSLIISVLVNVLSNLFRTLDDVKRNLEYKEFALTDVMTGLGSRLAYMELCEQYKTHVPDDMTLIFMDTNQMKYTNDNFGHSAGDEIIIATAQCIKEAFGDSSQYFRMGGDEFLVVIRDSEAAVDAQIVRFEQLVGQWTGVHVSELSVSTGTAAAATYPGLSFEELTHKADQLMYANKRRSAKARA